MDLKEILSYWKTIIGLVILVAGAVTGVLAFAEDQKQLMRAEQQLIHSEQYQEGRVEKKRNQIQDNLKMIRLLESDDDELSLQEQKFVESLREEIERLFLEIEEIETLLNTDGR